VPAPAAVEPALERFRLQIRAQEVTFWLVTDATASCLVRCSARPGSDALPIVTLTDNVLVADRLRRRGVLICRAGEISGVEELAPAGSSYAVFAVSNSDAVVGTLVLGWDAPEPPCDDTAFASLRLAAAALLRSLTPVPITLADAILKSINDRITVVDGNGAIITVNDAVSGSALEPKGPSGHTTLASSSVDGGWSVVTETPFRHPSGGTVITHTPIAADTVGDVAQRIGERLFDGLIDSIPMPIWICGANGRVTHANAAWRAVAQARGIAAHAEGIWTDVFHPADRGHAAAALESASAARLPFSIELRLGDAHGAYRSALCHGAPYAGVGGALQGYVGCCYDISGQRHAERALTEIGSKLLNAQEEERGRIARELHDDLGQQTALLATKIETLLRASKTQSPTLRDGIADAGRGIQDLAVSIHNLSHELHPPKLKLLGLVRTLESLCRNLSKPKGPTVAFTADPIPSAVPERISLCLCRVAQEALQNAVKHSGARQIAVGLTAADHELTLRISDDGRGFDPFASSAGIGLVNMRERVELNGGRLSIQTSASGGTTIEALLPFTSQP
jgi:signal transduction histidine kinase